MATTSPQNGASAGPRAASADQFRRHQETPALLVLPDSGLTVAVRRVHVSDLAAAGAIPNDLLGPAMRVLGMGGAPPAPDSLQEQAQENRALVNAVCIAALAEPRMLPEVPPSGKVGLHEPDAIAPDDMPWADREHVFEYVCRIGRARPLATFPHEQAGRVAPVQDGDDLRDEA
jgi:hypothetical protein